MKSYILVSVILLVLAVAFFGLRNAKQHSVEQVAPTSHNTIVPITPPVNNTNPSPTPAPTPAPVPTPNPIANSLGCTSTTGSIATNVLGVSTSGMGLEAGDGKAMIDLGVKWLRDGVRWTYLEPTENVYSWQEQDNVVKAANQYGINLLLGNPEVPDWVWNKNRQGRIDAVYAFYKTLATRYKGKVKYYEIFNEPNLSGMFYPESVTPQNNPNYVRTYLDFLAAANKAIHEADPNAVVVIGGLAEPDYAWMNPTTFMQKLYELGGKDCFDVFAYHPYASGGNFKAKADAIRKFLASNGDSTKPIWFNELGANEADQIKFMNQMKDEISAVPAWFWFSLRDWGTIPGNSEGFGLMKLDFQKRPAYDLFKQIIKSQ